MNETFMHVGCIMDRMVRRGFWWENRRLGDPWIHYAASQSASGGKHLLRSDPRRGFRRGHGADENVGSVSQVYANRLLLLPPVAIIVCQCTYISFSGERLGKSCNILPLLVVGRPKMFSRILLPRECFVRNYAYLLARCWACFHRCFCCPFCVLENVVHRVESQTEWLG